MQTGSCLTRSNTQKKGFLITVKFLNFHTPENFAVIYLKFKQRGQILGYFHQKDANGIANSVDPDQTPPLEQSDLGLHCLPRPICPKRYIAHLFLTASARKIDNDNRQSMENFN